MKSLFTFVGLSSSLITSISELNLYLLSNNNLSFSNDGYFTFWIPFKDPVNLGLDCCLDALLDWDLRELAPYLSMSLDRNEPFTLAINRC